MRTLILALLATALAACTALPPADAPLAEVPTASAPGQSLTPEASACRTRGGTLRPVGRMQSMQCVIPYADASKACTDGDHCQGDCRVEAGQNLAPGARASGRCQATSDRFGCITTVEDGRADVTLCID